MFRNGWNFNPIIHEQLIGNHPAIQNCILVGTGQDKPAAIIELQSEAYTEEVKAQNALLESLWPTIAQANSLADTSGRLEKDYIIFAKKEKPFKITGKGTVQRKATLKKYESETNALYMR